MSEPVDPQIVALLRSKHDDVTEREAMLFEHLYRAWPYLPPELMDIESGKSVASIISDSIEEMYGLRFQVAGTNEERKKKLRSLNR